MNSVGRRGPRRANQNGPRRRRRRTVRPVVVVQPNRAGPRRRNGRRKGRGGANPVFRPTGGTEVFVFSVDNLKANSSGAVKFGPSLSQCPALSDGILKSYHRYKITSIRVEFKSHASATTAGAIFIELDTACKQSALGSYINSFTISRTASKVFRAEAINGKEFQESTIDQFWMLYKANGTTTDTAGQFIITMSVSLMTAK
uniref:Coat protein n=1 Tax=Barley yellow dwarf virus (isolate PAV) TaxID=2169986 RepID=A0A2L0E8Z8_BYDVP|nr:coat protein [Barley yellow dwarf virus PAV]AUX13861.1 coat protein [Barley yellow dwarf virus PAV]AUX13881.1 coat protein [Barley yellow dwarf virus PAV]AUX13883.1 coat protein [Barley yellow dwarf virus PAV]AUX13891.1 coat protein [Barley yellow dwarf virus PAV]